MGRATEPHKGRNSSPPPRMQNLCTLVCLLGVGALHLVHGFGGHFNRYNPALQPNLGYGGGNYYNLYTESKNTVEEPKVIERNRESEGPLEKVEEDDDPCHARKCTANEHCCEGHVCVDTQIDFTGTCMPMWGKKQGETCFRDNDCETGFVCMESAHGQMECQEPSPGKGKYGDDCRESSDCNIHKGLCCTLHRRARMQPKKLCTYFTDAASCIGPVATHQVRNHVEHTAGEKRMSAHPDDYPGQLIY